MSLIDFVAVVLGALAGWTSGGFIARLHALDRRSAYRRPNTRQATSRLRVARAMSLQGGKP